MFLRGNKKQEYKDRMVAYKRTFDPSHGKEVLIDLMNRFHVLNAHKGEPYQEGQRSVVLEILKNCHIDLKRLDEILSKGEIV